MERLTKRYGEEIVKNTDGIECSNYCTYCGKADCEHIRKALHKLAHYEDLEEQGRLIELPCKVGDTVYYTNHSTGEINPFIVNYFEMNKFSKELLLSYAGNKKDKQHWKVRTSIEHFEDRFCKTKEEAEAKLKELKEGAE